MDDNNLCFILLRLEITFNSGGILGILAIVGGILVWIRATILSSRKYKVPF